MSAAGMLRPISRRRDDGDDEGGMEQGMVEYRILGRLAVLRDGRALELGGFRQRAVLAALLVADDHAVEADRLIEQVWGADAPPKPLASLRSYVTNLRRIVGSDVVTRDGSSYRLDTIGDTVDAREFTRLVDSGRQLLDRGEAAPAMATLRRALDRWRGTPLVEFGDLDFATPETHRLEAMRVDAVELRFEAALRLGESAALIDGLESALTIAPLRETLWGQLMLAMHRCGRRTDALQAYARVSRVLDDELGVKPGIALERLATDIRNESAALDWQPPVVTSSPPTSEPLDHGLFGRSAEVRRLRARLPAGVADCGGVVVLSGDSGMGKTALAQHVTELAGALGVATAWAGHAAELHRPPSWAWAHALRSLAGQLPRGEVHLHAPLPEGWTVATDNADYAGFDVVEATTRALAEVTSKRPALIVLDDLHRADHFTLDVLEHLVSCWRQIPLLIVATWQDDGVDAVGTAAFERLRSRTDIEFVTLRGLSREATAELIADTCGVDPQPGFVTSVHTRTGGNPFYIRELIRLLADTGRMQDPGTTVDEVPEAVSGVIRRRMSTLPEACRVSLYAAAVMGTEFEARRLADATARSAAEVAEALNPAQRAGLITELPRQPGGFRFSHGLVRDAVAAEITGVQRARLHADIARTYADEVGDVASQDAIDGAEHAWRAADEVDAGTALALLEQARADAWSRSAYREVAELDRRALAFCHRLPTGEPRFGLEIDLRLQLASVEAVVNGQSSAKVLEDLCRSAHIGDDTVQSTAAVAMGCLAACGTGRYHDAAVLSDSLVEFFAATADPIAGAAGYYIRALTEFMSGKLDLAIASVETLQSTVPTMDWESLGALASFEVLAYAVTAHSRGLRGDINGARAALSTGIAVGTGRGDAFGAAVLRVADIQLSAMLGESIEVAQRAAGVVAELTELGIDQFIGGARLIHGWARAVGPDGVDVVDEMRAAMDQHEQGGRRIFSPLYYGLLCDAAVAYGEVADAAALLARGEAVASATGEHVWDAQLSARRLRLVARERTGRR